MKRLYLLTVAAWLDLQVFAAEIRAHDAARISAEAEKEVERAAGWLRVHSAALATGKARRRIADLALQRHDRHRALGIG